MLSFYESRIPGLKKEGGDYRAACPIHQGKTDNSFSVDPTTWKWFCHGACNEGGDMVRLVERLDGLPFPDAKAAVERHTGVPVAAAAKRPRGLNIVEEYDYFNKDGTLAYQVVRLDPKSFRQRQPDGNGGWSWSLKGVDRLLYCLPDVMTIAGTVYIAEGEKDVDALRRLGLNATCNSGGAGKFTAAMAKCLGGRDVVILPDQDEAGNKHSKDVATLLLLEACRVKIVDLPGAKDPAEWLEKGGTLGQLRELQMAAPAYTGEARKKPEPAEAPEGGAPPAALPANVWEMLQAYVIIAGTDSIFCRRTGRCVKPSSVKLVHGNANFKNWVEHPKRMAVDPEQLVFKPQGCAPGELNLFAGLPPLVMAVNDVHVWLAHVSRACEYDEEAFDWVIKRLAFKVQFPHRKLGTAIVIHGKPGSGKNLLFAPIMSIFGQYAREVGQVQLDSAYTGWLSGALLILCDEVEITASRTRNKLKSLITSPKVAIEEKYQPVRFEDNLADLHFLSNEEAPIVLEQGDRRYMVLRLDDVDTPEYYANLAAVDPGAVRDYLMAVDVGGFNPAAAPPHTARKEELTTLTKPGAERFLDEWLAGELPVPAGCATAADLYTAYTVWAKTHGEARTVVSANAFGRATAGLLERTTARLGARVVKAYTPAGCTFNPGDAAGFGVSLTAWLKTEQERRL